jgi:hypothetical protein
MSTTKITVTALKCIKFLALFIYLNENMLFFDNETVFHKKQATYKTQNLKRKCAVLAKISVRINAMWWKKNCVQIWNQHISINRKKVKLILCYYKVLAFWNICSFRAKLSVIFLFVFRHSFDTLLLCHLRPQKLKKKLSFLALVCKRTIPIRAPAACRRS